MAEGYMGTSTFRLARRGRARARLVGFVITITVALVLIALPAFAHHPIPSGKTVCTNGEHVITWTIGNSENDKTMTIDSATAAMNGQSYAVTGYSSTVGPSGTTSATTKVPGPQTGTITLTVKASWTNGVKAEKEASVALESQCLQPTTTTTAAPTTTTTKATTTTTHATTTTTAAPTTTTTTTMPPTTTTSIQVLGTTTIVTSGTTAPKPPPPDDPTTSTTGAVVVEAEDELPFTGGTAWGPILGLIALGAGGVLLFMSRRRFLGQS
jgi:hypothetical protein